jgi:electron transfer flavoprotein alpha subunit
MTQDLLVIIEHYRGQVSEISYIMLAHARSIAQSTGGKVFALLCGHQVKNLAKDLGADNVLYLDHPSLSEYTSEAYSRASVEVIKEKAPRMVLMGETTIGAELAGILSVRLALPLISFCTGFTVEVETVGYLAQICAGKIMIEGNLPAGTVLATVLPGKFKVEAGKSTISPGITTLPTPELDQLKITFKRYLEPESADVDITKQDVLVAIGRGIQQKDNLELAEDLAEALDTVIAASRPVIDQNWLPTSRLIGKSGKTVKPKVYLAFGISGAPEHIEGISSSDMIIAVNTDPAAPIFNYARYGAEVDILDLLPVLTEKVKESKG